MKANKYIKEIGPFRVDSISQDGYGVRLVVYPAFMEYEEDWAISRVEGNGGGPGIFTAMAMAKELETFLNQGYDELLVKRWRDTITEVERIAKERHDSS